MKTKKNGCFSSTRMYHHKIGIAVLHYNSLILEEFAGERREQGGSKVQVKGRVSLAVKRRMTPALHDWREEIMGETLLAVQKKRQERREEKELVALGAPTSQAWKELMAEEERERDGEGTVEENEREEERVTIEKNEDMRGEEEEESDGEDIGMILNRYGLESEWEDDSEEEESHVEDSDDSFTEESGGEEWEESMLFTGLERGRGRGRGRGSQRGVERGARGNRGGGRKRTARKKQESEHSSLSD